MRIDAKFICKTWGITIFGSNSNPMSYKGLKSFLLLMYPLTAVLLFSCNTFQKTSVADTGNSPATQPPRILFVNYVIRHDEVASGYQVDLISKTISEGRLKDNDQGIKTPAMNDLEYVVLDMDSSVLDHGFIANPLYQSIEFVGDDGLLSRKDVVLDSNQFFLRIQLDPAANTIYLRQFTGSTSRSIDLIKTHLP